jgi:hemolysin activation/secretion protein
LSYRVTISKLPTLRFSLIGAIGVRLLIFFLAAFHPSLGSGQSPPPAPQLPPVIDPTGRSGEPPPLENVEPLPPTPPPTLILPPVDTLPELQQKRPPLLRVLVSEIHVEGSTVFSTEELANVTAPFENRELSTEDLEKLRRALTLMYVNQGYVNSGAIIPDQAVQDGKITIKIIEGELTDIQIEGTQYFLPFYLENRIALDAGPPFNIRPLKERLQILLQDPRIARLNTELKPGLKPGEAILHARVQEAPPFRAWVEFNNFQSPTVGAERGWARSLSIMYSALETNFSSPPADLRAWLPSF